MADFVKVFASGVSHQLIQLFLLSTRSQIIVHNE